MKGWNKLHLVKDHQVIKQFIVKIQDNSILVFSKPFEKCFSMFLSPYC